MTMVTTQQAIVGTVRAVAAPRERGVITRERIWNIESAVTGVLGALIAKRLIRAVYKVTRKQEPRSVFDPDSEQFSWSTFVVWAVAGGLGLGIAKLVSNRVATIGWRIATGTAPPSG
jgi:hypothetical protein